MACPLVLEMPLTPVEVVTDALECAGIRVGACMSKHDDNDFVEHICERAGASFALSLYRVPDNENLCVAFFANLSKWRWWNFPLMWLLSIPNISRQIELQREAYLVLRGLGAKRIAGGEVLLLDESEGSD